MIYELPKLQEKEYSDFYGSFYLLLNKSQKKTKLSELPNDYAVIVF